MQLNKNTYLKPIWIFLHIEGAPFERGFQHGYLLAKELYQALKTIKFTSEWDTGDTFNSFENAAIRLYRVLSYERVLKTPHSLKTPHNS